MTDDEFVVLERAAAKPAEELLERFLDAMGHVDTETLEAIADYRDAIRPNGWLQTCIREYLDVWR